MRRLHIFILLLIVILIYLGIWFILPKEYLPLHVHDKTVPEPVNYREHRELFYLSKHWKFTDSQGNYRDFSKDYSGYHPLENQKKEKLTKDLIGDARLLYLADAYGIYDYEAGLIDYEERLPFELIDIDLLFGGFDENEIKVINDFARNPENTIVGEHNVFGYPTYIYPGSSQALQELFGVKYEGWLVRYYEDLEEVAYWVKLLYTRIYGSELNLKGPGLVVVREDSNRAGWYGDLLIFQNEDFKQQYPMVITSDEEHFLTDKVVGKVPYLYWVEVLTVTNANAKVLAEYEFPLKEEALEKLKIRGIEPLIPAFIYLDEPSKAKRIYFSGDFIDQLPALLPYWMTGSANIQRTMSYLPGIPPQYHFYFRWYAPVIKNVKEIYTGN